MKTIPEPPKRLPGYENIKRYWDNELELYIAKIAPGEFYVTQEHEVIATTLGSCVSACIRDKVSKVGGMNHFLLPIQNPNFDPKESKNLLSDAMRYGNWAMEYLINEILKYGGIRRNLEVKIFGGSQILQNVSTPIGESNIKFVLKYIHNENLQLIGQDVGSTHPRRVLYFPHTGIVKVKKLKSLMDTSVYQEEENYFNQVKNKPIGGDIELF